MQSPLRADLGKQLLITARLCSALSSAADHHTAFYFLPNPQQKARGRQSPAFSITTLLTAEKPHCQSFKKQTTFIKVNYHGQKGPKQHKIIDRRSVDNSKCFVICIILILSICSSRESFQRTWSMRHN